MPKIYVIPSESPNAFATGRNPKHASVAVTHGILELLDDEEFEGVSGPRIGSCKESRHPYEFDSRYAGGSDHNGGSNGLLGITLWRLWRTATTAIAGVELSGLFMIILAPIAASLIQLAISRSQRV